MVIVYAPTKIDYFIFRFISVLGVSVHILDKHNVIENKSYGSIRNFHLIEFVREDRIGLLNYFDYPKKNVIEKYLSSLRLEETYHGLGRFYPGIDRLAQKLDLTLLSSINYFSSGLVYAYYLTNRKSHDGRFIVINCELSSFISHEYKIFDRRAAHILFPFGNVLKTIYGLIKTMLIGCLSRRAGDKKPVVNFNTLKSKNSNIAIFFHKSDHYGRLFKKDHYFSNDKNSLLYWERVAKYAVNPDETTPSHLMPLKARIVRNDYFLFFNFISPFVFFKSSFNALDNS